MNRYELRARLRLAWGVLRYGEAYRDASFAFRVNERVAEALRNIVRHMELTETPP